MIEFSSGALEDLERIFAFNEAFDPATALETISTIRQAIQFLEEHPYVGRLVRGSNRELVIGRGKTGFVALYHHDEVDRRIRVLAVRHQRERRFGRR